MKIIVICNALYAVGHIEIELFLNFTIHNIIQTRLLICLLDSTEKSDKASREYDRNKTRIKFRFALRTVI